KFLFDLCGRQGISRVNHSPMSDATNDLDAADLKLLRAVQADSTHSTAELAEAVGLSQPSAWRRLQRLREAGYIVKEAAVLDREMLGFSTQVFALVKLTTVGRANLSGFAETIRAWPEVVECHVLMGAADFLLKVVTRDIHAYERFFFEKLSVLDGVQDV